MKSEAPTQPDGVPEPTRPPATDQPQPATTGSGSRGCREAIRSSRGCSKVVLVLLAVGAGGILVVLVSLSLDAGTEWLRQVLVEPAEASVAAWMDRRGRLLLEMIAVASVGIAPGVYNSLIYKEKRRYVRDYTTAELRVPRLLRAFASLAVVLLVVTGHPVVPANVGLTPDPGELLGGVLFGGAAVAAVLWGIELVRRRWSAGEETEPRTAPDHIAEVLRSASPWEKLSQLAVMAPGVAAEELVLRGYLVLYLGSLTGMWIPWALLSVGLSVLAHLYQGRTIRKILFHVLFASGMVGLSIWRRSIWAAIGVHGYNNALFLISLWRGQGGWYLPKQELGDPPSTVDKLTHCVITAVCVGILALIVAVA